MTRALLLILLCTSHGIAGWTIQSAPTTSRLNSVTAHHGQDDVAWICGDEGTILHTTDGGLPFNPSTTIRFSLGTAGHTSLHVFDVLGREVATLVNETLEAGEHKRKFEGSGLTSGVYFYRLISGEFIVTKKLLLAR